jgi:hypothetical protein
MRRIEILKHQISPLNIIKEKSLDIELNYGQLNYEKCISKLRGKESKFLKEKGTIALYEKDKMYLSSLKTKIFKKNGKYFINTENEEDTKIWIENIYESKMCIVFGTLFDNETSYGVHGFLIHLKNCKEIEFGKMKQDPNFGWFLFFNLKEKG